MAVKKFYIRIDEVLYSQAKERGFFTKPKSFSRIMNMALRFFLENYKGGA